MLHADLVPVRHRYHPAKHPVLQPDVKELHYLSRYYNTLDRFRNYKYYRQIFMSGSSPLHFPIQFAIVSSDFLRFFDIKDDPSWGWQMQAQIRLDRRGPRPSDGIIV
jgi:hypothetical protein